MYFQNLPQSNNNNNNNKTADEEAGEEQQQPQQQQRQRQPPRQETPRIWLKQMEDLKSCCYFFNLKLGCKLIALFEVICGFWQTIMAYKDLSFEQDPYLSPQWKDDNKTPKHEPELCLIMGLITLFCSQLLLAGVAYERKVCLLLYLIVTATCTLSFMFYTLVIACIPELLLFDAFSAGLQAYFLTVVFAYYTQMQRDEEPEDEDEIEVLYTASSA